MTGVIGERRAASTGETRNWAMSATGGSVAWRRRLIGLSSTSALIATAALRRSREVDLDGNERQALESMREQLTVAAESLRTGVHTSTPTPAYTFAFSQLAYISKPETPPDNPDPEMFAAILEHLASELRLVERWNPPAPDAAVLVFDVFEALAGRLLEQIARPGESYRSPRRAMA